jgi:hypothetical protein
MSSRAPVDRSWCRPHRSPAIDWIALFARVVTLGVLACSSPRSSTPGGDASDGMTDASESGDEACEPFGNCGGATVDSCGCSASDVCDDDSPGPGVARVEGACEQSDLPIALEGTGECTLAALAAGASAAIKIDVCPELGPEDSGYIDHIVLLGDGTAVFTRFVGTPEPIRRVQLQPSEFFEACQVSTDPAEIAVCLTEWYADDVCAPVECCEIESEQVGPPLCG